MTPEEFTLKDRELKIQEDRLKFEQDKATRDNKFLNKHFGVIITMLISLATIVVSISQLLISDATKINELTIAKENNSNVLNLAEIENNRRFDLDIANYLTINRELFFKGSSSEKKQFLDILIASFDDHKVSKLFERIKNTQELSNDTIVTDYIKDYQDEQRILEVFNTLTGDQRHAARKELIYRYTQNPKGIQEIMLTRLRNPTKRNAYREQLGIVYALGQIPGGWEDRNDLTTEINAIIANSADETLIQRAKEAIANTKN